VVQPRFRWQFPELLDPDPTFDDAGRALGLSPRMTELLRRRDVTAAELQTFFAPPEDGLCDPALLPDAEVFLDRIHLARSRAERVVVFGDFDADGLTGLAILTRVLRRLGIEVLPYVPRRLEDGHGLSRAAIEATLEWGSRIIVTVDCGTSSLAEVVESNARGIDVLITDHHRVPPDRPPALAIVNPQRAESVYPHRRLAGSGVAFKLAQLLLGNEPGGAAAALDLADLATIGTVADVAPILGENRSIARLGLERIRRSPRPGIGALLERAGVPAGTVDLETIAFVIAPRINAAGRMGEAADAAALLLTDDPAEAAALAARLDAANTERRQLTRDAVDEAEAAIATISGDEPGAIIVRGPWPVGIVGLVASRLAERRGRPAVVGADLGDVIRASCRSAAGFDLAAALETCAELLTRHGGHPGAAGLELPADRWPEFVLRFQALVAESLSPGSTPELHLDLVLEALEVDYRLLREFAQLSPTGPGNPDPVVAVRGLTVTRIRPASGGHAQLTLRRDRDVLDAIAFDRGDLVETVHEGDRLDVVARLMSRTFGGYESLQLEVRDVSAAGARQPQNGGVTEPRSPAAGEQTQPSDAETAAALAVARP
jgi:single-stranded-DNA-specific exonuclease